MLRQTVAAGKSILSDVSAHDPALQTSAAAFVAEVQAVAPAEVSAAWKTLGSAVVAIVKSGGTNLAELNSSTVKAAANTVASDAKTNCHLDLSAVTG